MSLQEPALEAFLACDSVSRDANGKAFLSGLFSRIFTRQVPAAHGSMALFFRFRAPAKMHEGMVQLVFRSPSGLTQATPDIPFQVPPGEASPVVEGEIQIQGLPLPEFGSYEFELAVEGKKVGTCRIDVVQLGVPNDAPVN
jgi:hypothetical protein